MIREAGRLITETASRPPRPSPRPARGIRNSWGFAQSVEGVRFVRMLSEAEEAAFDIERHRSVRSRVAAQQREAAYAVWGKHYAPYGIWHDDSPMTPGDRSAKESLGRHLASFPQTARERRAYDAWVTYSSDSAARRRRSVRTAGA